MAIQASFELLVASLVAVLIGVVIQRRFFHPLSKFPGPFFGSVTSLYHIYYYLLGTQKELHRRLHLKYGPVVRYGPNQLILSDPTMLPEIYHMKANKSNFYNSTLNEASETVFSEKHNVAHKASRRILAHAYSMARLKDMEPEMQQVINTWITRLYTREKEQFVLFDRVLWLTYDVLGIMIFGEPFGFVDEWTDIRAMLERSSKSNTSRAFLEIINLFPALNRIARESRIGRWLLLPWPTDKVGLGVLKAERDAAWAKYFQKKRAISESCLLSQMLSKRTGMEKDDLLSDDRIKAELLIAILAGSTTTATILHSVIINVAADERYCTQLSSEITAAFQRSGNVSYELSRSLSYLDACVQEAFRFSAFPTQFPRLVESSKDIELNGIRLPPGTVTSSSSYIVARNESLFGSQLDEFSPERWLSASESIKKARRKYDFRFGYGSRTCLGKNLVELEIYNTVFEIFRRTEVKVLSKEKGVVSMKLCEPNCTKVS